MTGQTTDPRVQGWNRAWVVSLTPFDASGALDEKALRAHLRRARNLKIE